MISALLIPINQVPLTARDNTGRRLLREHVSDRSRKELETYVALSSVKSSSTSESKVELQKLMAEVLSIEVDDVSIDDEFHLLEGTPFQ
jgi:hypothetical protein